MLFLDACAVIYLIEGTAPWATRLQQLLPALAQGDPDPGFTVSDLSRMECRVRPWRENRQALLDIYDGFFAAAEVTVVPLSHDVVSIATGVRARSGLRAPDALQAACCISLGRATRFVTNDRGFRREPALDVVLI